MPPGSKSARLSPLSWIVLKRQLVVLFVCAGLLGTVVGVLYSQNRKHERGLREQQGLHRVDVANEFLSREINAVRSDLLYLAEQDLLKRFLSGEADARTELEGEYARFARRKAVYDQIRCLDTLGKEIVRINFRKGKSSIVPASDLQQKEDRYYPPVEGRNFGTPPPRRVSPDAGRSAWAAIEQAKKRFPPVPPSRRNQDHAARVCSIESVKALAEPVAHSHVSAVPR